MDTTALRSCSTWNIISALFRGLIVDVSQAIILFHVEHHLSQIPVTATKGSFERKRPVRPIERPPFTPSNISILPL
jgi:hypothetical protein